MFRFMQLGISALLMVLVASWWLQPLTILRMCRVPRRIL